MDRREDVPRVIKTRRGLLHAFRRVILGPLVGLADKMPLHFALLATVASLVLVGRVFLITSACVTHKNLFLASTVSNNSCCTTY